MKTILLIGLGNPGKKYVNTRHNAGFLFVDSFWKNFRDEFGFSEWEFKKKLNAEISIGKTNSKKIILAKPRTFMNLSGEAAKAILKYYKAKLSDLVVVHDEIDLPLGTHRFSTDSSAAGHKGVQNIIDLLGTKNFTRLRIGVDNRGEKKIQTDKYVLSNFSSTEVKKISETFCCSTESFFKELEWASKIYVGSRCCVPQKKA